MCMHKNRTFLSLHEEGGLCSYNKVGSSSIAGIAGTLLQTSFQLWSSKNLRY